MAGIELARAYYEEFGRPMLAEFPAERIAVGLAGHGSECFGFDDEISRDHDFSVGFALWLTEEDDRAFGFRLGRAYERLLKEHPPRDFGAKESRFGEKEHGVCLIGDFYRRHIGCPGVPSNWRTWLNIPDYALAEAVNGAVFRDDPGEFSRIREGLLDPPEEIRLKRLSARCILMAQSGQYNFDRCHRHGEDGAAQLALTEFVREAAAAVFLLNRRWAPYYKWLFRAMRELPRLNGLADSLEFLLRGEGSHELKLEVVELIADTIVSELRRQDISDAEGSYLEAHAFSVRDHIPNRELQALHPMA